MNTRLVLWGEIGTDRSALIAIHLDEGTAKINIYAFPKEEVTKEIQDALFVEWKNGGEFTFPENAIRWEVDANSDTILPENVRVDRPEIVLQSQHKWSKKLMSSKINQLLTDEIKLLDEKVSTLAEYDQSLWDKAKAQWEKISSYQKKNEISWEQTTVLKDKINTIFDALKAIKRINNENEDQANHVYVKQLQKRIEELQSKLIYADQWKYIFDELKKIQNELKDAVIRWNQKRSLYDQVNAIFDDLRKYRMTEVISKTKGRISQLQKILDGLKDSIARDKESYSMQVEKMQHYTRGKLSEEELKSRFGYIVDKTKEKEVKIEGIQQTIAQLKKEIEKEKRQQEEREQQKLKREQEQEQKKQEQVQKKQAKAAKPADEKLPEAEELTQGEEPVQEEAPAEVPVVAELTDENSLPEITDIPVEGVAASGTEVEVETAEPSPENEAAETAE